MNLIISVLSWIAVGLKNETLTTYTASVIKHLLGIFEDSRSPYRSLLAYETERQYKRESGKLSSMNWFLRVGATGFEPAT